MQLEHTSERLIEEYYQDSAVNYLIYLFHLAAYEFARPYVKGKDVLDFGSGSGYGTHRLTPDVSSIVGVDIDQDAINFANNKYQASNLSYVRIASVEAEPLPFADESFDSVISFQVIEHVSDVTIYLKEINRVLKHDGVFICATPDRSSRLLPGQKPWNMWHLKEYTQSQLASELAKVFSEVQVLQQGGKREVIELETKRTRTLMWLTLPITLPFIPEKLRKAGLKLIKQLKGKAQKPSEPKEFPFGLEDLIISSAVSPSVNLIATAKKS